MSKKNSVFISYRHKDSIDDTGKIYDRLAEIFGKRTVFRDIQSIPLGVDFREYIGSILGKCDVVLVVIGNNWLNISNDEGQRLLDDPKDIVRVEVASTLERNIPIIPLFVQGASVPTKEDLPDEMKKLVDHNGMFIGEDTEKDLQPVIEGLEKLGIQSKKSQQEMAIDGFEFVQERVYSCGGESYEAMEYKHTKTQMDFVLVPEGSFLMGSENGKHDEVPIHEVKLNAFLISRYPVTQKVWKQILWTEPWKDKEGIKEGDEHPVTYISWSDAKNFCRETRLSLPTEAQWEYACRASTSTPYYWGEEINDDFLWYANNTYKVDLKYPQKVGQKKPNAFGLYDMLGNIWEWCEDSYQPNYNGCPQDGKAHSLSSPEHVNRGGGYNSIGKSCRSAKRSFNKVDYSGAYLGFRVVVSI